MDMYKTALAKHEHSTAEMERNRIAFYKRFKRIREREQRTCQLIGETSEKHRQKARIGYERQ